MASKDNPGSYDCYANAEHDEEMFILLARDPLAPILVDLWAELRMQREAGDPTRAADFLKASARKIGEAREVANRMRKWRMRKIMEKLDAASK